MRVVVSFHSGYGDCKFCSPRFETFFYLHIPIFLTTFVAIAENTKHKINYYMDDEIKDNEYLNEDENIVDDAHSNYKAGSAPYSSLHEAYGRRTLQQSG